MDKLRAYLYRTLRWTERYTKTDMVYLAQGGFWINLNYIFGSIVSLILSILFAHYVSKEIFGVYKYIISIAGLTLAFSLNGMNTAVARAVAQGFEGIFKRSIYTQIWWILPQILLTISLSIYYFMHGNSVYGISFIIISIFSPISTVANTYGAFLQGKGAFKDSALYGVISNIFYFILLGTAILYVPTTIFLIATYYIATAITNVFFCWRTFKKYRPSTTFREEDITYGKHMSLLNVLGMFAAQIDNIILYHLLGPASLAIYSFATVIPERLRALFGFISTAALPKLSEQYASGGKPDILRKTLQLICTALVLIVIYVLAAPLIFSWFFPQYLDSITYSQVFSISLLVIAANIPTSAIFARGSKKGLYTYGIVGPLFRIAAVSILIYFYGIWGAVISRILSYLFQTGLSFFLAREAGRE